MGHPMEANRRRRLQRQLLASPCEGSREHELWNRNQGSPLLRLPPEIRNRIYELVLHVGMVKVMHRQTKPAGKDGKECNHQKCAGCVDSDPGGFFCLQLPETGNPFSRLDWRTMPRGMTLLSPVCRQLYHETAVLPFSLNAWCFGKQWMLDRYLLRERRLPKEQRRAIRVLFVDGRVSNEVLKLLGGLRLWICPAGPHMALAKNIIERRGSTVKQTQGRWIRYGEEINLYDEGLAL